MPKNCCTQMAGIRAGTQYKLIDSRGNPQIAVLDRENNENGTYVMHYLTGPNRFSLTGAEKIIPRNQSHLLKERKCLGLDNAVRAANRRLGGLGRLLKNHRPKTGDLIIVRDSEGKCQPALALDVSDTLRWTCSYVPLDRLETVERNNPDYVGRVTTEPYNDGGLGSGMPWVMENCDREEIEKCRSACAMDKVVNRNLSSFEKPRTCSFEKRKCRYRGLVNKLAAQDPNRWENADCRELKYLQRNNAIMDMGKKQFLEKGPLPAELAPRIRSFLS